MTQEYFLANDLLEVYDEKGNEADRKTQEAVGIAGMENLEDLYEVRGTVSEYWDTPPILSSGGAREDFTEFEAYLVSLPEKKTAYNRDMTGTVKINVVYEPQDIDGLIDLRTRLQIINNYEEESLNSTGRSLHNLATGCLQRGAKDVREEAGALNPMIDM